MELTEKAKARRGMLYDANYEKTLMEERLYAKSLCFEYNNLHPRKLDDRQAIIRLLLGSTDGEFLIEQPFFCDYGYNIKIGRNFYANYNCVILDPAEVTFGDNVFVGPNCAFYMAQHPLDVVQRNQGLEYAYPIKIGNNVWLGAMLLFCRV